MRPLMRMLLMVLMAAGMTTVARADEPTWCEVCDLTMIQVCGGYSGICSGGCYGDGTPGQSDCYFECCR